MVGILGSFFFSLALFPLLGCRFFPRTDPGQFVINIKAPTGTRLELTDQYIKRWKTTSARWSRRSDLGMIVSNIGITPDFSAIYTSNSGQHTAFVQVSLKEDHKLGSYEYMRPRAEEAGGRFAGAHHLLPVRRPGGLRSSIWVCPRPSTSRSAATIMDAAYDTASADLRSKVRGLRGVSDVLIPQDLDYPGIAARRRTARWRRGWAFRPRKRWTTSSPLSPPTA